MKDVKTKRALGPLGGGVDAHSAGPGNDCGHEAVIVLGPECPDRSRSRARLRIAQTNTQSPSKTTHPCAHNAFRGSASVPRQGVHSAAGGGGLAASERSPR